MACIVLALLVSTVSPASAAALLYRDGSYQGSAAGYAGPLGLTVQVDGGSITGITIGDNNETPEKLASAKGVIAEIIAKQGTDGVSTVSGATRSSRAIIAATDDALSSAIDPGIFESGRGTAKAPFIINTAGQLSAFRDSVNDGEAYEGVYIALGSDIDIQGSEWVPIGLSGNNFAGAFDGNGHIVSGLSIGTADSPAPITNAGFFSILGSSATVKGLGLTDVEIYTASAERSRAGGIAAQAESGGAVIDNCYVSGAVVSVKTLSGQISYAGGLLGQSGSRTTVANSWSDISVMSEAGGVSTPYAGGLVAMSGSNNVFVNNYALGDVAVTSSDSSAATGVYVGGLAGMQSGRFYNCYATGDIIATGLGAAASAQYTAVGALNGQLISSTGDMDTVFFNSESTITVNGLVCDTVPTGVGNASSKQPTNAVGLTAAQIASDALASSLNQGIRNIGEAPFPITLPEGVALFGWAFSDGRTSLTAEPYVPGDIDTDIFESGDGTEDSPYIIADEAQLRSFAGSLNAKIDYDGLYVALGADIALSSAGWQPVGGGEYAFAGVFDGAGHTVSGLSYESDGSKGNDASQTMYIGFFGVLNGTVKNLNLTDVNIKAVGDSSLYTGTIAGYTNQGAIIDSCSATGTVHGETITRGNNFVGGISATLYRGYIVNSWSDVKVSSVQQAEYWAESGGICAMNNRGYVLNCYTLGDVYAYAKRELEAGILAGNIVGINAGFMANCYAYGDLETSAWTQEVGAVAGNTTGIGQGYFLSYNKEALQDVGGQRPDPAIGVGLTVKTVDEDDGVTVISGFNYELAGHSASYMKSAEFAAGLNSVFNKFPLSLPDGIRLKEWAVSGGTPVFTDSFATINVVPVEIYDDAPAAFYAGEYMGRDEAKSTLVNISVTDESLTSVTLIAPAEIPGSDALIAKIKANPALANLVEVEGDALLALREAISVALGKAKVGDASGYGAASPSIFAGGSGTQQDPYTISTEAQLKAFAASVNVDESYVGKYVTLASDITISTPWVPAGGGNATNPFSGIFNGGGHTISNMAIGTEGSPASYQFAGFIGYIDGASISDLVLENIYINNVYYGTARAFTGAFAGGADRMSYFDGCSASGQIITTAAGTGNCYVGGIIGFVSGYGNVETNSPEGSYSVFITNSSTDINIKGVSESSWVYAGGISGMTNRSYIVNCYTRGDVIGHSGNADRDNLNHTAVGGIAGMNAGRIINAFATGNMHSLATSTDVGGFAGRHTGIAYAEYVYFNADAEYQSGNTKLDPAPGAGYIVSSGEIKATVVGKSAAEMHSQGFADLLNNNAKSVKVNPLPGMAWKSWTYDEASGQVGFASSTITPPDEPGDGDGDDKPGDKPGDGDGDDKPGDNGGSSPITTVPGKGTSSGGSSPSAPANDIVAESTPTSDSPAPQQASSTSPFADVNTGDWFYQDVMYAYSNKLFNGTSADSFSPDTAMTRGMLVTVLHRLHGATPAASPENPFSDIAAGTWYYDAVAWAAANGLANGISESSFGPNEMIKRQDLAALIQRYLDFSGKTFPVTLQYVEFADSALISDYAQNAVQTMVVSGIMNGKPGTMFDPQGGASRAEVAAVLHRLSEKIASAPVGI
jgi:uncharacterized protein with FMN-binding domain